MRFMIGFVAGTAVGALLALLFAPSSGEELRGQISRESEARYRRAEDEMHRRMAEMHDKMDELTSQVKEAAQQARKKGEELADELQDEGEAASESPAI